MQRPDAVTLQRDHGAVLGEEEIVGICGDVVAEDHDAADDGVRAVEHHKRHTNAPRLRLDQVGESFLQVPSFVARWRVVVVVVGSVVFRRDDEAKLQTESAICSLYCITKMW